MPPGARFFNPVLIWLIALIFDNTVLFMNTAIYPEVPNNHRRRSPKECSISASV